jgi:hypothetical protein
VKKVSRLKQKKKRMNPTVIVNQNTQSRHRKAATKHVHDLVSLLCKETCGKLRRISLKVSSESSLKMSIA